MAAQWRAGLPPSSSSQLRAEAGDRLDAVESEQRAREVAEARADRRRRESSVGAAREPLRDAEDVLRRMAEAASAKPVLNLVLKADVQGSLEAARGSLEDISGDEIEVRVLHGGVGGVNESDVLLAAASGAEVIGFGVRAAPKARGLAEARRVEMSFHGTIYELMDAARASAAGRLEPERREEPTGEAEVLQVFDVTRVGRVAGCRVLDGAARAASRARVVREGEILHDGRLRSLRRFKDEAQEVRAGSECGISLENFQDFRAGDRLEFYEVREVRRTL